MGKIGSFLQEVVHRYEIHNSWLRALELHSKADKRGEEVLLLCFEELPSTQDLAHTLVELSGSNALEGIILTAVQSSGRGREGREWIGEKGNFFCTFLIPCDCQAKELAGCSVALGFLTVMKLLKFFSLPDDSLWLKWPNDIVDSEGKKIGGILTELEPKKSTIQILVGVGINFEKTPDGVRNSSSLAEVFPERKEEIVSAQITDFSWELFKGYASFFSHYNLLGIKAFLGDLRAKLWGVGKLFTVALGKRLIKGECRGIGDDGTLHLVGEDGRSHYLASGHVIRVEEREKDNLNFS